MIQRFKKGDLVKIIDDPMSFAVGDDFIGLTGMISEIDEETEIFSIMITGSATVIRVLDFMIEKIK